MPGKSKTQAQAKKWWQKLNQERIREALDEATVDAYGDDEQHSGLLSAIEDELEVPFSAMVLGQRVKVVDIEWPNDDPYGLDLACERDGQRQRIEARSVDLVEPLPEGHLFLAAYLAWKQRL